MVENPNKSSQLQQPYNKQNKLVFWTKSLVNFSSHTETAKQNNQSFAQSDGIESNAN